MNVHEANQRLLMLCRDSRDTSKAERDAARLALEQAIEEETKESKPPGYTIHISGSGLSMVLRLHGEWLDSEPHAGDPNRAREYLRKRAWRHHDREMERLREEALRA